MKQIKGLGMCTLLLFLALLSAYTKTADQSEVSFSGTINRTLKIQMKLKFQEDILNSVIIRDFGMVHYLVN